MGPVLFVLCYIIASIAFYHVFFKMRYKESNEKVKFSLFIWILGICILGIPILNIICALAVPIVTYAYNADAYRNEEVYYKSILTKEF